MIVNMAMSDFLLSIFLFPDHLVLLYTNSWVIGGPLSQLLCKFTIYAPNVSFTVSVQSLVLIAVDRFGAVIFPLRSPLINSKRCRFYILATWIIAMAIWCPDLFAWKVVEFPEGLSRACVRDWNDAFGESSSFKSLSLVMQVVFVYVPLVFIVIVYSAITLKIKSQKIPGQQSTHIREKQLKRERKVLKLSNNIILWLLLLLVCFLISSYVELRDQPLDLCMFWWKLSSGSQESSKLLFFWSWRWAKCTVVRPRDPKTLFQLRINFLLKVFISDYEKVSKVIKDLKVKRLIEKA